LVKKQEIQKEKIMAISEKGVVGAVFDKKNQDIKYYDSQNGTVWRISPEGKEKTQVSEAVLKGLKSVLWSPDNTKVLTIIEKNGRDFFYEYDYSSNKGIPLKEGLDSVTWDNIGAKIFYKYYDAVNNKRSLNIANPDGSSWQKIADIEARNISIESVPLSAAVSYWNFPSANEETKLQIVSATGGDARTIFSGKWGADYLWAPDGSKLIVSSLTENKGGSTTLGFVSLNGEYQDLGVPTFASKCVWSQDSNTIYYTIPGGIPEGSIIPNDYNDNKFTTKDTFWKMNSSTGEKERIVEVKDINGQYDASNLFLSADESSLYFINKVDQKLYRIEL
jgi:hypothetical protein